MNNVHYLSMHQFSAGDPLQLYNCRTTHFFHYKVFNEMYILFFYYPGNSLMKSTWEGFNEKQIRLRQT